jgi:hypothetical protein
MVNIKLPNYFSLKEYEVKQSGELVEVTFFGQRTGKPSKRFTLYGGDLKIKEAFIQSESKNKVVNFEVERINYLPTFNEMRIHTKNLQYPGIYTIKLLVAGKSISDIKSVFNFN